MVAYEKVLENQRIDLFDATVFAACQMLEDMATSASVSKWLNDGN